jgi:dCMP deaminase
MDASAGGGPGGRPSWDEYFLGLMTEVGKRATCDRGKSGCVIVKDRRIVATGYVGSPPGFPHCDEAGHQLRRVLDEDGTVRQHCVRTIHAEQNAICQAARYGIALAGAALYCRMEPCRTCALLIVSVGIARVVAGRRYHAGEETREIFRQAGCELLVLDESVEVYPAQTG